MTINNTNKKVSRSEALLWVLIIALYAFILYYFKNRCPEISFVRFCVLSSLVILLLQIRRIVIVSGSIISPCLIYLGLYYVFQNGLLLLSLFETDFNSFYLNYFQLHLKDATIFASISNLVAGYTCFLVNAFNNRRSKYDKLDSIQESIISQKAFRGFIFSGLVAIPLIFLKTTVALKGGYFAVRDYESTIPFVFNFIEYMFMPFVVLSLLYSFGIRKKIVIACAIVWLLLTSFCGDRTTGLSGILIIAVINYKAGNNNTNSKKKLIKLAIVLIALVFFVQLFGIIRGQGSISDMQGQENSFIHFFGELGFSSITLFAMMDIVPGSEAFLNGTGYLASLVSGFLPASIDPTGTIDELVQYRALPEVWMEDYYDFGFGLGFSLNSEAYINFGWFGLLFLFFINYVVFYFLNYSSHRSNSTKFDYYVTFILLFLWCTLPRRDSYYIWKALMYSVIVIRWYLILSSNKKVSDGAI